MDVLTKYRDVLRCSNYSYTVCAMCMILPDYTLGEIRAPFRKVL